GKVSVRVAKGVKAKAQWVDMDDTETAFYLASCRLSRVGVSLHECREGVCMALDKPLYRYLVKCERPVPVEQLIDQAMELATSFDYGWTHPNTDLANQVIDTLCANHNVRRESGYIIM
ncbi:hypothetical protein KIPB_016177, partial [Kipferlia bialata]